jgi:hypothetical protein
MQTRTEQSRGKVVEYDSIRRRLWIRGQRCHHGATGCLAAAAGCFGILVERNHRALALVATGTALMAHDWKDRSFWFERGYGTQP